MSLVVRSAMAVLASLALLVACGSEGSTSAAGGAPDAEADAREAGPDAGRDAADADADEGGNVDVVVTFAFGCGPSLECSAGAQYCLVAGTASSPTYACPEMPAQCMGMTTCACLDEADASACPCAPQGIGLQVTCG
jgi:hypothetical protein